MCESVCSCRGAVGVRGQSAPLDSKKTCKKSGKRGKHWEGEGKNWEKEEKSGRKGKNQEGSFTLPLLTDRAGYATAGVPSLAHTAALV